MTVSRSAHSTGQGGVTEIDFQAMAIRSVEEQLAEQLADIAKVKELLEKKFKCSIEELLG